MLKYKLDEIESAAKRGEAISHHVAMTMVKEIRKLITQKANLMEVMQCFTSSRDFGLADTAKEVLRIIKNTDNNNET